MVVINDRFRLYLFGITVISISFRLYILSVVLSFVSIFMLMIFGVGKKRIVWILTFMLFFLLYFIFGASNYERGLDKFININLLIFSSSIFLFCVTVISYSHLKKIIIIYGVASVVYVLINLFVSMMMGLPGYGLIYDVFQGELVNSPLYALQLSIFGCLLIYSLTRFDCRHKFIISTFVFLVVTFFSGIYLSSRASVILIFFFIFSLSLNKKYVSLISYLAMVSIALFFGILYLVFSFEIAVNIGGFAERGIESPRFDMLITGFSETFDYPFGGMETNKTFGYTGVWFHNMFLDIVRVSGYWVMIFWSVILLLFSIKGFRLTRYSRESFFSIFILLNLALFQDLAFDGFYNIISLEFLLFGWFLNDNSLPYRETALVCRGAQRLT